MGGQPDTAGTAVWLDGLSRRELSSDGLAKLAGDGRVVGVAGNPTVLYEAVEQGAYDDRWGTLAGEHGTVAKVLHALVVDDARSAADVLAPVRDASGGRQGHVTLELPPSGATTAGELAAEARRLWTLVGRPNLLVTLPTGEDGIAAAAELLAEGIGVHVSPVFSPGRYRIVAEALRPSLREGGATAVVSAFVSPVDTEVDKLLWSVGTDASAELRGRGALANAWRVHEVHRELMDSGGACPRLAWAGTGVRDPYYADGHYVDGLPAGPELRIVPEALLGGSEEPSQDPVTADRAGATVAALDAVGVDLAAVVAALDGKGVERFTRAWRALAASVEPRLPR